VDDGSTSVHCPECGALRTVELAPDRTFELHCDSCGLVSTGKYDGNVITWYWAEE
jgi:predicted  nucleic acid-binding Zn ribbon protein